MRFTVAAELELFAESVRGALAAWDPLPGVVLGNWGDDRDDVLAARLAELGWAELWSEAELLGPAVAGGIELGRAVAPIHLVDEATLGAPLGVDGRVRHAEGRASAAWPRPGGGLLYAPIEHPRREASLDSVGTVVGQVGAGSETDDAPARWHAWSAASLAYFAGLAAATVDRAVEHARSREQFGAPLASLPAVQAKLADAALARDGLALTAWSLADAAAQPIPASELIWAGSACRSVTAIAQQVHGAIGFALESGLHRAFRRAKTAQVWADAVCRATRPRL
jgi:hypothetical protein